MNRTESRSIPKIAIIGRPNVGKSSLFNRILKQRKAITESVPGVTRDRLHARVRFDKDKSCILIDTGGIASDSKDRITQLVYKQSRMAIDEADAIMMVCDINSGITAQDEHIASILRKSNKPVFLVVNKVDNDKLKYDSHDFIRLGLGDIYSISVLHNRGMVELNKAVSGYLSSYTYAGGSSYAPKMPYIRIAIVGRPNVGKSSFVNLLLEEERVLVDDQPGTTRDSVDVHLLRDQRHIILVDTAGMRHKRKIKELVDMFSLGRAKESVRTADLAMVMIDVTKGLMRDDIDVLQYVFTQGKPCVLVVNKSDLAVSLDTESYASDLRSKLNQAKWLPIIFCSCLNRKNIIKALDYACTVFEKSKTSIPTSRINDIIGSAQRLRPHPFVKDARPKIYYATQVSTRPVKFIFFVSDPSKIRDDYLRYIENTIRRELGFEGIPLMFELRAKSKKGKAQ